MEFVRQCGDLRRSKGVRVVHGVISPSYLRLGKDENDSDVFMDDDPMIVLMEYMRIQVRLPLATLKLIQVRYHPRMLPSLRICDWSTCSQHWTSTTAKVCLARNSDKECWCANLSSLNRNECLQLKSLQNANIPLSKDALDKLIRTLDTDGDGEVDFK